MKILALEDDPVSMKKLSHDLQSFGHSVFEAADSVEALNLYYENNDFDLIITDLEMPFGNGVDFIKDIRTLNKNIPILVISGTIDQKSLMAIKKYKCLDILVKPHDKSRLEAVLNEI